MSSVTLCCSWLYSSGCLRNTCWLVDPEYMWSLKRLGKHSLRPSKYFYTEGGWVIRMGEPSGAVVSTFWPLRYWGLLIYAHILTYTHVHTYMYTPMTYILTYMLIYTHLHIYTYTHVHTPYTCILLHTCTHMYTLPVYTYSHTHACTHPCTHTHVHTLPSAHTHIHSLVHTYSHMHIHLTLTYTIHTCASASTRYKF